MPYLRCEDCGARALPIATRCPACQAPFVGHDAALDQDEIRTRREALRPCAGCDSLIDPTSTVCRWCEAPNPIRKGWGRPVAAGIGVIGVAAALWWFGPGLLSEFAPALAPATPTPQPSASAAAAPSSEGARIDPEPSPASEGPAREGGAREGSAAESGAVSMPSPQSPVGDLAAGWSPATSRTFVNIRSAPGTNAPIVGIIGEGVEVRLGARDGQWREVRSGALSGWVFESLFRVDGG
jgi:hypothetical protein